MTANAMQPARVVLFTADACLTADLATSGLRVKDVLNDPNALMEVTRLTYSNPDRPGVPLVDYPAGALRKSEVGCVVVLSEPHLPTMRRINAYVPKSPVRVSIMIPGMVVVGTLHVSGRFDPTVLLTDAPEPFLPLTEAGVVRARTTTPTNVPPERLTVFVNRNYISGILLAETPDATQGNAQPAEQPELAAAGQAADAGSKTQTGRLRRFAQPETTW